MEAAHYQHDTNQTYMDAATTAGAYSTRARPAWILAHTIMHNSYTYRCGFDTVKTWNVSVNH